MSDFMDRSGMKFGSQYRSYFGTHKLLENMRNLRANLWSLMFLDTNHFKILKLLKRDNTRSRLE